MIRQDTARRTIRLTRLGWYDSDEVLRVKVRKRGACSEALHTAGLLNPERVVVVTENGVKRVYERLP